MSAFELLYVNKFIRAIINIFTNKNTQFYEYQK